MTSRQWGILTLLALLLSIAAIVGSVVLIDPFEIYHQATAFIAPIQNGTQIYSNAGIAKTYDYDSLVIGSSMTENFRPSQLDRLFGGSFVKLSVNAGPPINHKQVLDLAYHTHDVHRVLYGLDIDMYTYFYKTPKCEMPDYLYDDDLFNDVQYWFNSSVLTHYIPECLKTLGQQNPNLRDDAYYWGDLYTYGEDAVFLGEVLPTGRVEQEGPYETPELSQQTMLNVQYNLVPLIEAHPETEYLFFFPPYSLARWYEFYRQGTLGYHLTQKEAVTNVLLQYDNVKLYDFTADVDWITNLDNYIDKAHYGPWINDAMAERIAADEDRITSLSQVQENDAKLRALCDALADGVAWAEIGNYPN